MKEFYYELGRAIYRIDGSYGVFTKNNTISSRVLWFFYAINDEKKHTQKQICKDWNMKKTTINTIVKEYEKKGYIYLKPIRGEKREMTIELTDEGKEYANQILMPVYEAEKQFYIKYKKKHDMKFMRKFIEFAHEFSSFIESVGGQDDE